MSKNNGETKILSDNKFPVVGIGASAGGLDAFKKLIKAIPENSGMAYVLVQHLAPDRQSILPELLQKVTAIPVAEITDEVTVLPDHIYIIPSNKMLVANDGVLQLSPRPPKEKNLPIDLFFISLAEVHEAHAIGVVLSGTASDGTAGLKAIKEYGGLTFAQDEASAQYGGMPQHAALAGVVDFILPPEEIPRKIAEIKQKSLRSDEELENIAQPDQNIFKQILQLLRLRKGNDFTYYKKTTIRRRILRRMAMSKVADLAGYLKYLQEVRSEQYLLYQDLLIPVTQFFRDAKVFEAICDSVFPQLIKNKPPEEPVRIWVAACSTGEEAYSIAMCLKEFLGDRKGKVQIFATDISEPAIEKARRGIYGKAELTGVSPQRLQEFFVKTDDSYRLIKEVRDMCVFAVQNFLKDPPFGKIDFVSCRNVLIYLEPYLQTRALTTFHYALSPKGFLLLGKSETVSSVPDLFAPASKNDKLFTRKDGPGRFPHLSAMNEEQKPPVLNTAPVSGQMHTDFQKTAENILLSQYTPAGVIVNEALDIVHFRGALEAYLGPAPGKPTHNLLKMARSGLAFELRNIIHKARKEGIKIVKEAIPLQVAGSQRPVSIEAIPLPNIVEPHYLILFRETARPVSDTTVPYGSVKEETALHIQQLEMELTQAREDMRSITEMQEAANEELQSANEELLSSSEEMQSLNEELETSKEELQSSNEELTVINQEIIGLNEQVTEARNYAEAIIANMSIPLVVLDSAMRVKSANRVFYKTFQVAESETEGRFIYDLGNGQWNIEALQTLLEQILPGKGTITDYEVRHTFSFIGERIMLLNACEIMKADAGEKLILLTIEDITERRLTVQALKQSEARFRSLIKEAPVATCLLVGPGMRIEMANEAMIKIWGKGPQVIDQPLAEALPELKGQHFLPLLDELFITGHTYEVQAERADLVTGGVLNTYYFDYTFKPLRNAAGEVYAIMAMVTDVTQRLLEHRKTEEAEASLRTAVEVAEMGAWSVDPATNTITNSPRIREWFGTGIEKSAFDEALSVIAEEDHERVLAAFEQALQPGSGGIYDVEYTITHPQTGKRRIIHAQGKMEFNEQGAPVKMSGLSRDVTIWRQHQSALEAEVLQRTEELAAINQELALSNAELLHSNAELTQYAYVASHDLQEPLRKIQVFTGMLDKLNITNEERSQLIAKINQSAGRMSILIKGLLDFSRLAKDDAETEEVDLGKVMANVIIDFELAISEKAAVVQVGKLPVIEGISLQMNQLFHNLLSNALKFTSPDKTPRITIASTLMSNAEIKQYILGSVTSDYYHITISDNGIGFNTQYAEQIFEVFKRLHASSAYAGSGIGLALCRRIVNNHNGHLYAVSKLGEGTIFHIILPEKGHKN